MNSPVAGSCTRTTYMVYIDDSGDSNQDLLTALAIPVEIWADHLKHWKDFRTRLARRSSDPIPASVELHGVELGTNSKTGDGPIFDLEPGSRRKITEKAFQVLRNSPQLRVLSVYAPQASGSAGLYESLLEFVNEFCAWLDSYAIIWYDGTDPGLARRRRAVHRQLPYTRRILEDPTGYSSEESHLLQMVDLLAYSAHQAILNALDTAGSTRRNTYLRTDAYNDVLKSNLVWPGGLDSDRLPVWTHPLGIRGLE